METVGWHHGGHAGIVFRAKRNVESPGHELTCQLGFASESVNDPWLRGAQAAVEVDDWLPRPDGVDYKWLAHGFGEPCLALEHRELHLDSRPAEGVESSLAYGHHAGLCGKLFERLPGFRPGKGGAPGVYAGGIVSVGAQWRQRSFGGIDAYHRIGRGIGAMGVDVGEWQHGAVHGTGS